MPPIDDRPVPPVNPRPGVASTLGILNVVSAVLILIGLLSEFMWIYTASQVNEMMDATEATGGGNPAMLAMMGMDDARFVRFCLADGITGIVVNLAMLASGVGLINLRRWGSRLWAWTAWIKIVRLVLLCGIFVIAITPSISSSLARAFLASVNAQIGSRKAPSVADLTRVYSIMCLIMAAGMLVLGSIYPIVSLWLLGRPGVQAALADGPPKKEPEHP